MPTKSGGASHRMTVIRLIVLLSFTIEGSTLALDQIVNMFLTAAIVSAILMVATLPTRL
jgi:hypothetical protein